MPRNARLLLGDVFALTLGFAVASSSITVLEAARARSAMPTTAPTASVLSPAPGQIVSGHVVVSATASLDTTALQFQLSGVNLGPSITSGSCSLNWDTTAVTDGTYALTVLAYGGGGGMTSSSPVAVTVENTAPQITAVAASGLTSTSVVITWTTNQPSTSGVVYGLNSPVSSLPTDWSLVAQHSARLGGLSPGTFYRFRVTSTNSVGLQATSPEYLFTTTPAPATGRPVRPGTPPPSRAPVLPIAPDSELPKLPVTQVMPPFQAPSTPVPPPAEPRGSPEPVPSPPGSATPPPATEPALLEPTTISGVAINPGLGVLPKVIVILERSDKMVAFTTTDSWGGFRFDRPCRRGIQGVGRVRRRKNSAPQTDDPVTGTIGAGPRVRYLKRAVGMIREVP